MNQENIPTQRSTLLRKTDNKELKIDINQKQLQGIFLINGSDFRTKGIPASDLLIKPYSYYMVINKGNNLLNIQYNQDISNHEVIYDPYKYETSQRKLFEPDWFKERYSIPVGYIDTLPKWYSFKFTYPDFNLIFIRPEFGLSIQTHKYRDESWEILKGNPIIISGNKVHYFVEADSIFQNPINTYHSIINPNKEKTQFVLIKERWKGDFDEYDIDRVFNPNYYE
ncbi:MAG: hypothetical protein HWN81_06060 [Candidatus Lokiarchaeota archaeon]|nr:hypothetical protein [Candidatus Lokiarchaeota archaeon]